MFLENIFTSRRNAMWPVCLVFALTHARARTRCHPFFDYFNCLRLIIFAGVDYVCARFFSDEIVIGDEYNGIKLNSSVCPTPAVAFRLFIYSLVRDRTNMWKLCVRERACE